MTLDWQSLAACRGADPEAFFVTPEADPSAAKAVCGQCPVRLPCLAFALERSERFGVWGGLTERERADLADTERDRILRVVDEEPIPAA